MGGDQAAPPTVPAAAAALLQHLNPPPSPLPMRWAGPEEVGGGGWEKMRGGRGVGGGGVRLCSVRHRV